MATPIDEEIVETVGSCCDIYKKYMFGAPWYQWRNRCTGAGGGWESSQQKARENAVASGECTPASAIYITIKNSVTGAVLEDIRVCLGLMCTQTSGTGETYIGRYAYGTYGLSIAANGYENLIETLDVAASEYHLTRDLVPTGALVPGEGCDAVPSWIKPFCILFSGFITSAIAALTETVITPLQDMHDALVRVVADMSAVLSQVSSDLAAETQVRIDSVTALDASLRTWVGACVSSMYAEIEKTLIAPLLASVDALWDGIGDLWTTCEEIVAAAEAEVIARAKAITELDASLRAWITASIFELLMKKLDEGVKDDRGR